MRNDKLERIARAGILPVVAIPSLDAAVPLARALVKGGIAAIEVTLRTPCALDAIAAIRLRLASSTLSAADMAPRRWSSLQLPRVA